MRHEGLYIALTVNTDITSLTFTTEGEICGYTDKFTVKSTKHCKTGNILHMYRRRIEPQGCTERFTVKSTRHCKIDITPHMYRRTTRPQNYPEKSSQWNQQDIVRLITHHICAGGLNHKAVQKGSQWNQRDTVRLISHHICIEGRIDHKTVQTSSQRSQQDIYGSIYSSNKPTRFLRQVLLCPRKELLSRGALQTRWTLY